MKLRMRIALLMVLLTALPALLAVFLTRQLIDRSLDLGLNADVDAALQAGVAEARSHLEARRRNLEDVAQRLAPAWPGPQVTPAQAVEALRRQRAALLGELDALRIVLRHADGNEFIVDQQGFVPEAPGAAAAPGAPPRTLQIETPLSDGWALQLTQNLPATWIDNATHLAETLQLVRALRVQQKDLERSFWLPFLLLYGVSIAIALLLALRVGRGITRPVHQLLEATDSVAAGNWNVEVPVTSRDEIGRLSTSFNSMVRTLDAQNRRLVDLEKMAGWREMARALAHEVKNPLTPIQLTVEEMRERYTGDDESYRQLLDECTRIVVEEVESLRGVVNRFREFSRPVALETQDTDLNRLIGDMAALQRDLQVQVHLDDSIGTLPLDPDRMRQVFMNLAENARQALQDVQQPQLQVTTRAVDGERVEILFEDNGPGIPPSEWERIFEPYRSGTSGGLGLGLALVRGILLAHGGDIRVQAGTGTGACFRLELPRHPATPQADTPTSLVSQGSET